MKQLTLTIVIPVYNEQDHIGPCLEAIEAQRTMPLEVLVVDNNCTDETIAIAKKYKFVKVITETRQGRARARNAGFNAARGDIIGRIDADSEVMPNWVEQVLVNFQDPTVMGLTGLGQTNLIFGLNRLYVTFWSRIGFWTTHAVFRVQIMWGANMAIRKTIWKQVCKKVCNDDAVVHEDEDVSLLVVGHGGVIVRDNTLLVRTAGKSYLYWPKFWDYLKKTLRTKHFNAQRGTLSMATQSKRKVVSLFLTDILGVLFACIFALYSFVMWPIFVLLLRFSKMPEKSLR